MSVAGRACALYHIVGSFGPRRCARPAQRPLYPLPIKASGGLHPGTPGCLYPGVQAAAWNNPVAARIQRQNTNTGQQPKTNMKKVWYIVKPGFSRMTAFLLVSKGRNSVTMMATNPAFLAPNPLPNPTLATVTAACDKLEAAMDAYDFNRGKVEKEARDLAYEELKVIYRDLGGYVQLASKGEKDVITGAGFETVKSPTPPVIPSVPGNVRAEATKVHGQIEVRFGASKGHRLYKIYMTIGDPTLETGWELIAETGKVRHIVNGLDRFKTYSFRVVAVGAAGMSIPSDAASATAA